MANFVQQLHIIELTYQRHGDRYNLQEWDKYPSYMRNYPSIDWWNMKVQKIFKIQSSPWIEKSRASEIRWMILDYICKWIIWILFSCFFFRKLEPKRGRVRDNDCRTGKTRIWIERMCSKPEFNHSLLLQSYRIVTSPAFPVNWEKEKI
jgi:hypothetical protein